MKTETSAALAPERDTSTPRAADTESQLATTAQLVLVMLLWATCYPLITVGLELVPPFQFAAVRAYLFLRERLRLSQIGGLLLGFGGIILIAATALSAPAGAGVSLSGLAYVLAGALGVSIGNVAIKRIAPQVDALMAMGWQLLIGAVPLALAAAVLERPSPELLNLRFIAVVTTLAWAGTSLVFGVWCRVLQKVELSRANAFSFLAPIFAVIIGVVGFRERIGWSETGGGLLVLAGLYLANRST